MYNLIDYGDDYSKTSGHLWKYYRDEPPLNNDVIANFPGNIPSYIFKQKNRWNGRWW